MLISQLKFCSFFVSSVRPPEQNSSLNSLLTQHCTFKAGASAFWCVKQISCLFILVFYASLSKATDTSGSCIKLKNPQIMGIQQRCSYETDNKQTNGAIGTAVRVNKSQL